MTVTACRATLSPHIQNLSSAMAKLYQDKRAILNKGERGVKVPLSPRALAAGPESSLGTLAKTSFSRYSFRLTRLFTAILAQQCQGDSFA